MWLIGYPHYNYNYYNVIVVSYPASLPPFKIRLLWEISSGMEIGMQLDHSCSFLCYFHFQLSMLKQNGWRGHQHAHGWVLLAPYYHTHALGSIPPSSSLKCHSWPAAQLTKKKWLEGPFGFISFAGYKFSPLDKRAGLAIKPRRVQLGLTQP